ncbi:MAG: hypothetical protein WC545_02720 [Patescibacteria group bacterium]|jgi:hypothetical protein
MPKKKSTAASAPKTTKNNKKKSIPKTSNKAEKKEKKKIRSKSARPEKAKISEPVKKAKSIIVDVIEDEPVDNVWPEYKKNVNSAQPAVLLEETEEIIDEDGKDGGNKKFDPSISNKAGEEAIKAPAAVEAAEELDQQKKFFSGLVSEIKNKENSSLSDNREDYKNDSVSGADSRTLRRVGIYRRFAIKFILIVLVLAAIVGYFSFSKLTITLALKGETLNESLLFKVSNPALALENEEGGEDEEDENSENDNWNDQEEVDESLDPRSAVSGVIKLLETEVEETFPASGEEFSGQDIVGTVRIINEYSKSQPLVATTRLLSPDNKLFRIKNGVTVPAGGEVAVGIYADKPAPELAIGPTKFTIPGLWAGLQDKIYAKSDAAFSYQRAVKKYVKASDLEGAAAEISRMLTADAKAKAGVPAVGYSDWLYYPGGLGSVIIDAEIGEAKEEFSASASGKMLAISFSKEEAAKLAVAKLKLLTPDDKELVEFDSNKVSYSLDDYDPDSGTATIESSFSGTMILKSDSEIIDRQALVNLTEEQLITYFKNYPEIREYEFKFSPSFIKRAPSLVDRITIKIKD